MSLREGIRDLVRPGEPIRPGLYHFRREERGRLTRFHLRVDPDRRGVLVVNAAGVLHLNPTATEIARHLLDGRDEAATIAEVRRVYRASGEEVRRDIARIRSALDTIQETEDSCPIARLDLPLVPPFGRQVAAPYRADLALTYACNDECLHCYVARAPGEVEPLGLEEWKQVLDRLWAAGVPHVCFTGGEATQSPHLVDLVERAEDIGMVAGLLTNGRRLADGGYMRDLARAGLDHVQITIESHDAEVHDGIVGVGGAFAETVQGVRNALAEDVHLVTNTTLCRTNAAGIADTIRFLAGMGVRNVAMNSLIQTGRAPASGLGLGEREIEPFVSLAAGQASELGLRFIWYTPTHYCEMDPTALGLGMKRCTAAEYNICIEPDGQVLPCQSYYKPAGNILRDEWASIWDGPLFTSIRGRTALDERCDACPDLEVCGGGCPLAAGDRFLCTDSASEG